MIIFWIFTLFVGASAFAFAEIALQYGIAGSFVFAVVAMLAASGILSIFRRSLILRERITPEADVLQRTVETNRTVFWKRFSFLAALPVGYFAVMYWTFGLAPADAAGVLRHLLQQAFIQLIYPLFLVVANFALFFGPFYLDTRIGKTMTNPDNANIGVSIEHVRGQKAAVGAMKAIPDATGEGY